MGVSYLLNADTELADLLLESIINNVDCLIVQRLLRGGYGDSGGEAVGTVIKVQRGIDGDAVGIHGEDFRGGDGRGYIGRFCGRFGLRGGRQGCEGILTAGLGVLHDRRNVLRSGALVLACSTMTGVVSMTMGSTITATGAGTLTVGSDSGSSAMTMPAACAVPADAASTMAGGSSDSCGGVGCVIGSMVGASDGAICSCWVMMGASICGVSAG